MYWSSEWIKTERRSEMNHKGGKRDSHQNLIRTIANTPKTAGKTMDEERSGETKTYLLLKREKLGG